MFAMVETPVVRFDVGLMRAAVNPALPPERPENGFPVSRIVGLRIEGSSQGHG